MLAALLAVVATAQAGGQAAGPPSPAPGGDTFELPVVFPEHPTDEEDAYLCTAVKLPDRPLKLVGIEPTSDQRIVHHMLLFGEQLGAAWIQLHSMLQCPGCSRTAVSSLQDAPLRNPATHPSSATTPPPLPCRLPGAGTDGGGVELPHVARLRHLLRRGAVRLGQECAGGDHATRLRIQCGARNRRAHAGAAGGLLPA